MELNKIYNESCLDTMTRMSNNFIDLTVTSPPYDNLRSYKSGVGDRWGEHVWKPVIEELFRVTKDGGVVVWVVGDATIKGSETATSFKQVLWAMECGFGLHDTMIWDKENFTAVGSLKARYAPVFEYMFVFTKGKAKTFNPIKDRVNKHAGSFQHGTVVQKDGSTKRVSSHNRKRFKKHGQRHNIWRIPPCKQRKIRHSARFPEQLARDHILSWSNKNDLVYDPFMGSGTTAKVAQNMDRKWIGSEISSEYCEIIDVRMKAT